MNADGSDQRRLTTNSALDVDPIFSPTGTKILFSSEQRSAPSDLALMNPDGSGVEFIRRESNQSTPTWSPDGRNVAFFESPSGNFNIVRMSIDGTNSRTLTRYLGEDQLPAWSPDGTKIAYESTRASDLDNDYEIFTMDAEVGESTAVRLTNTPPEQDGFVRDTAAAWSPDGAQLLFMSNRSLPAQPLVPPSERGKRKLAAYRMPATGGEPQYVVTMSDNPGVRGGPNSGPGGLLRNGSNVAWSPDGTRIVFSSDRAGDDTEGDVYTASAVDGSDVRRLTNRPGFDGRCDWQPIPRLAVVPPIYAVPKLPVTSPPGKLRTSLTLRARPGRDRRPPFRFTFSGRVRIPSGVSRAAVCRGRVRLVLRKGRRTVARGTARVSRRCIYKKRITIRSTGRTGKRRARLRVGARFGGTRSLRGSGRSTTVSIY